MFLTDEELISLTQKKRRATQSKVLNALGITHKMRPDGSLVVLRSHVEKVLGGGVPQATPPEPEPNWGALSQPSSSCMPKPQQRNPSSNKNKARF